MDRRPHPDVAEWFATRVGAPTPPQRAAWGTLLAREHLLLSSPTGSGKSLAALVPVLSALHQRHTEGTLVDGVQCVYVTPLRALNADVARNLQGPLDGIADAIRKRGGIPPQLRLGVRTSDTSEGERRRQAIAPPHILVTTPESLAILLNAPRLAHALARVEYVVIDEIHALAPTRRGSHLALSLERLERLVVAGGRPAPTRVGLSATVEPLEEVARFLVGARPCRVERVEVPRGLELEVTTAVPDLLQARGNEVWEGLVAQVDDLVQRHDSTLVFANTRRLAEELVQALRLRNPAYQHAIDVDDAEDPGWADEELASADAIAPHHGSMSRDARLVVEARLKRGEARAVVSSASLELGIDVGPVDHVVLVGSPRDPARALQRIGRSGHAMGLVRRATLLALDPDDLAECVALARRVREGRLDPLGRAPPALDALAQHLAGLALEPHPPRMDEALALVRQAGPYADLPAPVFERLVDDLEAVGLLARSARGRLSPGGSLSRRRYLLGAGTIVGDRRLRVRHGDRHVGDLEESFAQALAPGDVFQLAGEPWRFLRLQGGVATVEPARGEVPSVPRWVAEGLPAAPGLLREASHLRLEGCREGGLQAHGSNDESETTTHALPAKDSRPQLCLTDHAFGGRLSLLTRLGALQVELAGPAAQDEVPVESWVDDEGRRTTAFLAPLGRRAGETLARALATLRVREGRAPARVYASDHGFALAVPRREPSPRADLARLARDATQLRALALEAAGTSGRLARRTSDVAERMLLLRGVQDPWEASTLRRNAASLASVRVEAERDLLEDAWDLPGAARFLEEIREKRLWIGALRKLPCASPRAFGIVYTGERAPSRDYFGALADMLECVRDAIEMRGQAQGAAHERK